MASIKRKRPAKSARNIVRRRIDAAIREVEAGGSLEKRVHEARQDLKKARAALKLLKPSIPSKRFKRENRLCRDAGRLLGPARDAQALQKAWERLHARSHAISRVLETDAQKAARRLVEDAHLLKNTRSILRLAREQAMKLSPRPDKWKAITRGIRNSYQAGQECWRMARRQPTDAHYHEWRKRAKDQRYQLDLFHPEKSKNLARQSKELEKLSDDLGDYHDFSVLRDKLARNPAGYGATEVGRALLAIESRERSLRADAERLARRVYRDRPKRFERRLRRHWKSL